ncbi:hypothetical protein BC829DRAFT_397732 [Chytridium lagenaria]|nr:hypothetical protein BC829DRAFT_397732 [Chytridium lagenaria]
MVLKWSEETTEAKMVSLVVPALRNRRMRIEAHKRAMGLTEEMFEEVEKDAERRVEDMKKGRRSLSRSSSVVPEGKITNFFAVRKSSSFTAGLVRVKTEEGELGSPSASPFVESPVNGMMDSTLVNEVVSVRVSKEGVEMAKTTRTRRLNPIANGSKRPLQESLPPTPFTHSRLSMSANTPNVDPPPLVRSQAFLYLERGRSNSPLKASPHPRRAGHPRPQSLVHSEQRWRLRGRFGISHRFRGNLR